MATILLISSDEDVQGVVEALVQPRGHTLTVRRGFGMPIPPWLCASWDAAFFDLSTDCAAGLATIALTHQRHPSLRITAIDTGGDTAGLDRLANAVSLGAEEFMQKPIDRTDAEALLDRLRL